MMFLLNVGEFILICIKKFHCLYISSSVLSCFFILYLAASKICGIYHVLILNEYLNANEIY